MAFLTDRTLTTGLTTADLFHIVNPNDTSQNPAGSSYKANLGQLVSLIPVFSGGSGNCITDFYVTNIYGCSPITIQSELNFNTSTASGTLSFAQGQITNAIGNYSHSQGRLTNATGDWSHTEGRAVQSSGQYSHAEGVATISSGTYSHSEGDGTESSGVGSHSEGQSTIASGGHSHAEGRETESFGEYSHSEGWGTIAGGDYQHVQGQYNLSSTTQSAFIIGNGVDNSNRSNLVFAVGNQVDIYGDLNVTGTIFSTGSTQFISTTGITISAVTLSTGTTYNGINYAGNVDLTIPSPSGLTGLKIIIKDEGGNAGIYRIRLTPSVGTIDGNSYVDMNINYMSLTLVVRNNNWWII
jgi:hypothetical protein